MKWTKDIDAYVDRRIAAGLSYSTIAAELGTTANAVSGRLDRRRAWQSQDDQVVSMEDPRVTQEGCRWIIGEPNRSWSWCGKAIVMGGVYCSHHAARSRLKKKNENATESVMV